LAQVAEIPDRPEQQVPRARREPPGLPALLERQEQIPLLLAPLAPRVPRGLREQRELAPMERLALREQQDRQVLLALRVLGLMEQPVLQAQREQPDLPA
jgi:hypothetical protein